MEELWQNLNIWSKGDQDRGFFFAGVQPGKLGRRGGNLGPKG